MLFQNQFIFSIDDLAGERDKHKVNTYLWPSEDGWPYPDSGFEEIDAHSEADDDALFIRSLPPQLFSDLNPLERQVITSHYGLHGSNPLTMKELHAELNVDRAQLRDALGSGLAKLRRHLQA